MHQPLNKQPSVPPDFVHESVLHFLYGNQGLYQMDSVVIQYKNLLFSFMELWIL